MNPDDEDDCTGAAIARLLRADEGLRRSVLKHLDEHDELTIRLRRPSRRYRPDDESAGPEPVL